MDINKNIVSVNIWHIEHPLKICKTINFQIWCQFCDRASVSDMIDGDDSDIGEDGEIWEEEGGFLVISADKVSG